MLSQTKDIKGERFGKLLVIEFNGFIGKGKRPRASWLCQCDCGNKKIVLHQNLIYNHTTSCGCYNKIIQVGVKYNFLTVLNYVGLSKHNKRMWMCRCDCGKIVKVVASHLINGNTKSCGCKKSLVWYKHGLSRTKEYQNGQSRKRKEIKKNIDSEWTVNMELALRKLQDKCVLCGSQDRLAVDHVMPLSKGFGLRPGNATILCKSCNSKKHNKILNDLPQEVQWKLINSAERFRIHWEGIYAIT